MKIINFYKKLGETPKEAIERLRKEKPEYKDSRLTYAGRLDPMAEGVLLILEGDYTEANKLEVLKLPKQYYFEVLWGFKSDTFDILGIPEKGKTGMVDQTKLDQALLEIKNLKEISYPPFSSKTLNGIPLFKLAREGKLDKSKIPTRDINIFSLIKVKDFEISPEDLLKLVRERIFLVAGDFRQKETEKKWSQILSNSKDRHLRSSELQRTEEIFSVSCFRAEVSTGTYIRSLANRMGEMLGTGALCLKIVREKVGEYKMGESHWI
ncbi:MAG: hypothetical protein AAB534_02035 [Patescibacteria group bacterium]